MAPPITETDTEALPVAELPAFALRIAAEQGRLAALQTRIAARIAEAAATAIVGGSDDWLDAKAAAAHLNVPISWVRDRARRGVLRSHPFGRYVRFRRAELDDDVSRRTSR